MDIRRGGVSGYRVSLPEFVLSRGDIAALVGPSGCGKSTLLEMMGTLLRPARLKEYRLGELDIATPLLAEDEARLSTIRARALGFMLQHGGLLPWLSVAENIHLTRQLVGMTTHQEWLDDAIDRLGIRSLLAKMPSQLSIGERQRVAFIRAIAHQPRLLLADEPTAALDPDNAERLFALMIEMVRTLDMAVIIVSHDWQRVSDLGLRCYKASVEEGKSVFLPA
ncbi:ABC transporter ATP-binding protein [Pectobacterium parmentieri]|uniref:ABC transporter ATP-binding protein n=1 Tax=Pectobacterium parmentieri TaxID=1905730 RepID=UPI0018E05975|nr:ATP-binding cassette domain-containing protein [Pectobacterium parmentieri]MBI0552267.1 ATP-binding cassette domain-containing protein [Pectobacterium parmentieri]MBI0561326.1 ATP-binding cassette domain-containing protein [Pectobacterium parmentieri]MBI0565531.1 ATP-binding cassette domain-containing protein [Pectobacterium parmentieri]